MVELFENSGDPDQTPRFAVTCLRISSLQWVNKEKSRFRKLFWGFKYTYTIRYFIYSDLLYMYHFILYIIKVGLGWGAVRCVYVCGGRQKLWRRSCDCSAVVCLDAHNNNNQCSHTYNLAPFSFDFHILWQQQDYMGRVQRKSTFEHAQNAHSDSSCACACAMYHPGLCSPFIHFVSNDCVSGQWMPWSDCADALADLGLRCPHLPEDMFLHTCRAAHIAACMHCTRDDQTILGHCIQEWPRAEIVPLFLQIISLCLNALSPTLFLFRFGNRYGLNLENTGNEEGPRSCI